MHALILHPFEAARTHLAGMSVTHRVALTVEHWGAESIQHVDAETDLVALSQALDGPVLITFGHVVYDKGLLSTEQIQHLPTIATLDADRPAPVLWGDAATWTPERLEILRGVDSADALGVVLSQWLESDSWASHALEPLKPVIEVIDRASADRAIEALWASCRKPIDGLVSTHINRHVSLFISRRLVNTSITPNQISVFCIALGIGSGAAVAMNTTTSLIVGAILLKLNSIIDGVDGELARVKWAYSKFGEWLDAAGDNVTNFSFFGALTYVMWLRDETVFAMFGTACLVMWLAHLSFVYAQLYKMKRGDVLLVRQNLDDIQNGWFERVVDVLRYKVLRRDFFVMLAFVMVLLGQSGPLLVIMCFGASIAFFGVLAHGVMSVARALRPGVAS